MILSGTIDSDGLSRPVSAPLQIAVMGIRDGTCSNDTTLPLTN